MIISVWDAWRDIWGKLVMCVKAFVNFFFENQCQPVDNKQLIVCDECKRDFANQTWLKTNKTGFIIFFNLKNFQIYIHEKKNS